MNPRKDKRYNVSYASFRKICLETEFTADNGIGFLQMSYMDFAHSYIVMKNGTQIPFDGLSEDEFLCVCNGGFYEDAEPINDSDRI